MALRAKSMVVAGSMALFLSCGIVAPALADAPEIKSACS
jgi:hypothetical protein